MESRNAVGAFNYKNITDNLEFICGNNCSMWDMDGTLHGYYCAFQVEYFLEINGLGFSCDPYKANDLSLGNPHKCNSNTESADSLVGDFSSEARTTHIELH